MLTPVYSVLCSEFLGYVKNGLHDLGIKKLLQINILTELFSNELPIMKSMLHSSLGYAYLNFKDRNYVMQAEHHAMDALNLLLLSEQSSRAEAEEHILFLGLLIHYTLGKTNLLRQNHSESLEFARKAGNILAELYRTKGTQNSDFMTSTQNELMIPQVETTDPSNTIDFDILNGIRELLNPGNGFYPTLEDLRIRLSVMVAKCFTYKNKFARAELHYEKATQDCIQEFGEHGKQLIPIYLAMGRLNEIRTDKFQFDAAVGFYQSAQEVAKYLYKKDNTDSNLCDLLRTTHQLSTAYINLNSAASLEQAADLLDNVIDQLIVDGMLPVCDDEQINGTMADAILYSAAHQSSVSPSCDDSSNSQRRITDLVCLLRSARVKIYMDSGFYSDGVSLLNQNLFDQRRSFGLYHPSAINTQKMLLSLALARGKISNVTEQAQECLGMEEFTFGSNSKQVRQTRDILETLKRLNKYRPLSRSFSSV